MLRKVVGDGDQVTAASEPVAVPGEGVGLPSDAHSQRLPGLSRVDFGHEAVRHGARLRPIFGMRFASTPTWISTIRPARRSRSIAARSSFAE